jgi:hypothetical protein
LLFLPFVEQSRAEKNASKEKQSNKSIVCTS